ncbi:retrotransposon protein, putative, ty1-copia subclass [Tanacetum coccineum]
MKELGPASKILGMEIVRDWGSRTLKVSQSGYVQRILNNYRIDNGKSVSVPLGAHFKVSLKDCLLNDWDMERMSKVPYTNVVGSLMYLMVCTISDIAYAVSIMSRYLANPGLVYGRDQGKHMDVDGFDTLKGVGAAYSGKEVEFEVELQGTKRITTIPARYRDEGNVSLSRPSRSKVDDMAAYAFAIAEKEDTHEPITFHEAINSSEKDEWVHAMEEEMSSLMKNHTWELVDQPPGQKLVSCKWLYKIKEGIEGIQKPRYKARLVARGFTQRAGIDYNEVFSSVVRHTYASSILSYNQSRFCGNTI